MNIEINTPGEQKNEFINQSQESYYQYLANMKINDTEDFGEDFSVAFMFL